MSLAIAIAFCLIVYLWVQLNSTQRRLKKLETRFSQSEAQAQPGSRNRQDTSFRKAPADPAGEEQIPDGPQEVSRPQPTSPPPRIQEPVLSESAPVDRPFKTRRRQPSQSKASTKQFEPWKSWKPPVFWKELEKSFTENWIGLVGAIALVIGLGFLGVYAAFQLAAIFRFFLLLAVSALLFGGYIYLNKKKPYEHIADYLRSSSAAILLFACLGAGGLPGLQWIHNPLLAFALLSAGVAVNLYLGYLVGKSPTAALHVILSLAGLATAIFYAPPDNFLIFIAGAVVSAYGIALAYRMQWDRHLLIIILSFFLFHGLWYFHATQEFSIELSRGQHIMGIVATLMVGILAVLSHYRKSYAQTQVMDLAYWVHFANWALILLALLPHSTGSQIKTLFILAGAVGIYLLARRARNMGIQWLYRMDTVVAQLAAVGGVVTLYNWSMGLMAIATLAFGQALGFSLLMWYERQQWLYRLGIGISSLLFICVLALGFNLGEQQTGEAALMALSFVIALAYHLFSLLRSSEDFDLMDHFFGIIHKNLDYPFKSLLGIIIPLLLIPLYWQLPENVPGILIISGLGVGLYILQIRFSSPSLWLGSRVFTFLFHANLAMVLLPHGPDLATGEMILSFLPLFGLNLAGLWIEREKGQIKDSSFSGLMIGLCIGSMGFMAGLEIIPSIVLASVFFGLAWLRQGQDFSGLWIGLRLGALAWMFISLGWILLEGVFSPEGVALTKLIPFSLAPLSTGVILAIFSLRKKEDAFSPLWGIYVSGIYLFIAGTALLFDHYERWLGILNLSASLISLGLALALRQKKPDIKAWGYPDRYLLHLGYAYLILYALFHLGINMFQSESVYGLSLASWSALSGLFTFIIWAFAKAPGESPIYKSWKNLHSLFPELILLWGTGLVTLELPASWFKPLWWLFMAGICLGIGIRWKGKLGRFHFYSLAFSWLAAGHIFTLAAQHIGTSTPITTPVWYSLALALLGLFGFVYVFYRFGRLNKLNFPPLLESLETISAKVYQNQAYFILFPALISTAFFLFQGFEKYVLTLMWMSECFLIFTLSILLRDHIFRYIAMACVAICMIRLPFYDLQHANTLERALSFIGVGLMLMLMNYIYQRFKGRFEDKESSKATVPGPFDEQNES